MLNLRVVVAGMVVASALCLMLFVSERPLRGENPQNETVNTNRVSVSRRIAVQPTSEPEQSVERLIQQLKQKAQRENQIVNVNLFAINVASSEVTLIAQEPEKALTSCGTPRWSKDGQKVLFDATPARNWSQTRLMSIEASAAGTNAVDLGAGNCPTISPDGKKIAFLLNSGAVPGAQSGIWMMDANGLNRRYVGGYGIPLWSPGGSKLLISSFSSLRQLSLLNVDTGVLTPIKVPGYKIYSQTSWGEDENTLLAVVVSKQGTGIAFIDITDPEHSRIKQVVWRRGDRFDVDPGCPVYSAETQCCVFTGRTKTGTALYSINLNELAPPQRLEPDIENTKLMSLAFSPDGHYVLFCSDRPAFEKRVAESKTELD